MACMHDITSTSMGSLSSLYSQQISQQIGLCSGIFTHASPRLTSEDESRPVMPPDITRYDRSLPYRSDGITTLVRCGPCRLKILKIKCCRSA